MLDKGHNPCHRRDQAKAPDLLVMASSTGGPQALDTFFTHLSNAVTCPVVIIQHLPASFGDELVDHLQYHVRQKVTLVADGMQLEPSTIYVAPGGNHTLLWASAEAPSSYGLRLKPPASQDMYRPSADLFFKSVADTFSRSVMAIILTGMGQDGTQGARLLHAKGACILAQDRASSAVWGMPRAAVEANIVSQTLSPEGLARHVNGLFGDD